jgi:hypothetical protein
MRAYKNIPRTIRRRSGSSSKVSPARPAADALHLPDEEENRYASCVKILSARRKPFYELGEALETVLSLRLFRGRFETFEQCAARLGFKKSYAYRLMAAARVIRHLLTIGDSLVFPRSESQVRPLTLLSSERALQAWLEVCARAKAAGKRITAVLVLAVVKERWPELSIAFVQPGKIPNGIHRLIRQGAESPAAALDKLRGNPHSDPSAIELLKKTVSCLRQAMEPRDKTAIARPA